jgi:hypothetical protein
MGYEYEYSNHLEMDIYVGLYKNLHVPMLLWKWSIVIMGPKQSLSFQFCDGAKVMSIPKKNCNKW